MKKWTSMEDFAKKPGYKPLTKTQHKAIEKYIKHGEVKNDLTDLITTEIYLQIGDDNQIYFTEDNNFEIVWT